tara:strand:+ start:806 stop:1339 length:534 start_codon:yes stop_codon:yes gene_type:complete
MTKPTLSPIRRLLRGIGAVLAAVWMILEEWVWDRLTAAMKWLGRVPAVRWLETRIARLSPRAAMLVFVVPWLMLLPTKVLALWLLGAGHFTLAFLVFLIAKIVGTALLARLFALTKPALLQVTWFRRFYTWFTDIKKRLFAYVRGLRVYQQAKSWMRSVRLRMRRWWRKLRAVPDRR